MTLPSESAWSEECPESPGAVKGPCGTTSSRAIRRADRATRTFVLQCAAGRFGRLHLSWMDLPTGKLPRRRYPGLPLICRHSHLPLQAVLALEMTPRRQESNGSSSPNRTHVNLREIMTSLPPFPARRARKDVHSSRLWSFDRSSWDPPLLLLSSQSP